MQYMNAGGKADRSIIRSPQLKLDSFVFSSVIFVIECIFALVGSVCVCFSTCTPKTKLVFHNHK